MKQRNDVKEKGYAIAFCSSRPIDLACVVVDQIKYRTYVASCASYASRSSRSFHPTHRTI